MTSKRLNPAIIHHTLAQLGWRLPIDVICLDTIDSTNDYLKRLDSGSERCVCIAERQTHGRGRLGRTWVSREGGNLYCSIKLTVQHARTLGPCSLIVGLSLLTTFKRLNIQQAIQLKWPNDLMFADQKLGGILIDVISTSTTQTTLVIGIGINLYRCPNEQVNNQAITTLHTVTSQYIDRNKLIAHLIDSLHTYLTTYQQVGWHVFKQAWEGADGLYGKKITLHQSGNLYTGTACGVDEQGQLILQDEAGNRHVFSSGETTHHHPITL